MKARVNRGFAFAATVGPSTSWTLNSAFSITPLAAAQHALGHLDDVLAQALESVAPNGSILVGAGEEFDIGISEQQVRSSTAAPAVLTLEPPTTLGFLVSLLGQLIGIQMENLADGYVAAAMSVAGCAEDVQAARDAGTWTRAAIDCLRGLDESVAREVATYLTKRGKDPIAAGTLAGQIVGKISIYLALIGPAFSTLNLLAEQALPASARTVNVFPKQFVLSARGVGPLPLGTSEVATLSTLTPLLGDPTQFGATDRGCSVAPDGLYHQSILWDQLALYFAGKKSDRRSMTLQGWSVGPRGASVSIVLPDHVTLGHTKGVDILNSVSGAKSVPGPGAQANAMIVDSKNVYFGLDGQALSSAVVTAGYPLAFCE